MSVAFTREEDLEATAADLPDRPVSPHANLVTPDGLAMIDAELAAARAAYAAAQAKGDIEADRTAMARARGETWETEPFAGSASSSPVMRQVWVRPSSRSMVTAPPKRTRPSGALSTSWAVARRADQ